MKSIILYVVTHALSFVAYAALSNEFSEKDTYWLDYEGVVPKDAIVGGISGETVTYIGQVLVPGVSGIIPVGIYPGRKVVVGTYYYVGAFETDKNIKILCTKNKNKSNYKWLPANSTHFPDVSGLIVGGYDFNSNVYIGRVTFRNNDVLVGKAFEKSALYVPTSLKTQLHVPSYEVLAFIPGTEAEENHVNTIKGYYWRPYEGEVPQDAVEGGVESGVVTYMALLPTPLGLVPAKIYPGKEAAQAEYYGVYETEKHVQILCSNNKHNFEWKDASSYDVLDTKELVWAGIEGQHLTYLARAQFDDDLVIAKLFVMYNPHETNVVYVLHNGEVEQVQQFQVLTYNVNNNNMVQFMPPATSAPSDIITL